MSLLLLFNQAAAAVTATVAPVPVAVQALLGSTWTDITSDVESLSHSYGISGNRPTDCFPSPGECRLTLVNRSGQYSPNHPNVRAGWAHGTPIRSVFQNGESFSVTSIIRTGSTATVATAGAHGLSDGQYVSIRGAGESEYNILARITVTDTNGFAYIVSGTPSTPASGTITAYLSHVKFSGKVDEINPTPGRHGPRAHVTAYDIVRDLYETDVRDVQIQIQQSEDVVIGAVLNALPLSNRPPWRALDAGMDLLPIALNDLGTGAKAAAVLQDVIASSYGLGLVRGDGTFRYQSRNERASAVSVETFGDDVINGLQAPATRDNVYNLIRTTNHPKTIDASDVVLSADRSTPVALSASDILTTERAFRDPEDARRLIGAASTRPMEAGVDYQANTAADGSGAVVTANLAVTPSVHATRVVFTIAEQGGQAAFLVAPNGEPALQIRGKGVYDNDPRTFTAQSGNADRPLNLDFPYAGDDGTTQQIGGLILEQYGTLERQIDSVSFVRKPLGESNALLAQLLPLEPGDLITLSESQTGLSSVVAVIYACRYELSEDRFLRVSFDLGPPIDFALPDPPASLAASVVSDVEVLLTWTTATAGAATLIYRDGMHVATATPGAESASIGGLTPATDYNFTARHQKLALLSDASNTASARPAMDASGGTVTEGQGFRYHTYTYPGGTFTVTRDGHLDFALVAGGGGAGATGANGGSEAGGGGGGGGDVRVIINNQEPVGVYDVIIGAGGAGGIYSAPDGGSGASGGDSTYRGTVARGGGGGGGVASNDGLAGGVGGSGGGGGGGRAAGAGGLAGLGNAGAPGYGAGLSNSAGGGGGGGAAGAPSTSFTTTGGAGGAGTATIGGTFGAGGKGGRGTGSAANGVNAGDGGGSGDLGEDGGAGASGYAVFRYPI